MCNLVVDEKHQRKGIATSLVYECERQVREWYNIDKSKKKEEENSNDSNDNDDIIYNSKNDMVSEMSGASTINSNDIFGNNSNSIMKKKDMTISNSVCLKVRESNMSAVQMYLKLGYLTMWQEIEDKTGENVLLMRKQLPYSRSTSSTSSTQQQQ